MKTVARQIYQNLPAITVGLIVLAGLVTGLLYGNPRQFLPAVQPAELAFMGMVAVACIMPLLDPKVCPLVGLFAFVALLVIYLSRQFEEPSYPWLEAWASWLGRPNYLDGLGELDSGLRLAPQLGALGLFSGVCLIASLLRRAFKRTDTAPDRKSSSPPEEESHVLLGWQRTWAGLLGTLTLIVATTVLFLYPEIMVWALSVGSDNVEAYRKAHAAFPAIVLIVLFASLLAWPTRSARPRAALKKESPGKKQQERNLDRLFSELKKNSKALVGTVEFADRDTGAAPAPVAAAASDRDRQPEPALQGLARRALAGFGASESDVDLRPFVQALQADDRWRAGLPDPSEATEKANLVLIEDTLLDYKLVPIAAMIGHHLAMGRNVVVVSDGRRIKWLCDHLKPVIGSFVAPRAFRWIGPNDDLPADPMPSILYGDLRALSERAQLLLRGTDTPEQVTARQTTARNFFRHAGLVAALDGHLLDIVEFSTLVRFLRAAMNNLEARAPQVLFQAEPMEMLETGIGNALGASSSATPLQLARFPGRKQRVLVWDYDRQRQNDYPTAQPAKGNDQPAKDKAIFLGVAEIMSHSTDGVQVIDETRDEDWSAWGSLGGSLKSEGKDVIGFKADVIGTYKGTGHAVFVDRDRGNLAAALLRDVAAPGNGQGLLNILSDPLPIRETLQKGIWSGQPSVRNADHGRQVQNLRRYLARVANTSGGLRELLQEIALLFLMRGSSVATEDISSALRLGLSGPIAGLDLPGLARHDGMPVITAPNLNALFGPMLGGETVGLFEDSLPLEQPDRRDEITCLDLGLLRRVVEGQQLTGRMLDRWNTATPLGILLPQVDHGLLFDVSSTLVRDGEVYFVRSFEDGGWITLELRDNSRGIDGRRQEVFARTYVLNRFSKCESVQRQRLSAAFGLVDYRRETRFKTERLLCDPGFRAEPAATKIVWQGAYAETVFLRLMQGSSARGDAASVARALCHSLQDVLDLKFPSVAHRLAVASPQSDHRHEIESEPADMRLSRLETSDAALVQMRAATSPREGGSAAASPEPLELLVIEDSDGKLGVCTSLFDAFRTMGTADEYSMIQLWRDHLRALAGKPSAADVAGRAHCDWSAAFECLRLSGSQKEAP